MDNDVEVMLFRRPDDSLFLRVRLRSKVKPNIKSFKDLDVSKSLSYKELSRPVSIICGALAEYQIDVYGDRHEPDECAVLAMEVLSNLLNDLKQSGDHSRLSVGESINAH